MTRHSSRSARSRPRILTQAYTAGLPRYVHRPGRGHPLTTVECLSLRIFTKEQLKHSTQNFLSRNAGEAKYHGMIPLQPLRRGLESVKKLIAKCCKGYHLQRALTVLVANQGWISHSVCERIG
ncbi:hypothetical protein GQ600_13159 [Phytophthora cactorum]|nr:hypothetical protein GQ600_13159 [Phytophthora cactorum]